MSIVLSSKAMIDIPEEQLIPLAEVPKLLPARPSGRRLHVSAVYRWVSRGVGGVRLEAIKIGGTKYASVQAIQRFGERRSSPIAEWRDSVKSRSKSRRKQIDTAARRVRAVLDNKDKVDPSTVQDEPKPY